MNNKRKALGAIENVVGHQNKQRKVNPDEPLPTTTITQRPTTITQLPIELLKPVFQHLSCVDLASLSRSCNVLRSVIDSLGIWNEVVARNGTKLPGLTYVAKYGKFLCEACHITSRTGHRTKKLLPIFIHDIQEEQKMCYDCRIQYFTRNYDDQEVPDFFQAGIVSLNDAKKNFKLTDDDLGPMDIDHQTYNHKYHTTATYYKSSEIIKKAIKNYGGLPALTNISKKVKDAVTRSTQLQISNVPSIPNLETRLKKLFSQFGVVKYRFFHKKLTMALL